MKLNLCPRWNADCYSEDEIRNIWPCFSTLQWKCGERKKLGGNKESDGYWRRGLCMSGPWPWSDWTMWADSEWRWPEVWYESSLASFYQVLNDTASLAYIMFYKHLSQQYRCLPVPLVLSTTSGRTRKTLCMRTRVCFSLTSF